MCSRSLASMLVALTVTPALSLMLLVEPGRPATASPRSRGGPAPLRRGAVERRRQPARVRSPPGVAALAGLALIPALDGPVIPSFKDRDLLVHLDGPPGTSRPEMRRIVARASRELRGGARRQRRRRPSRARRHRRPGRRRQLERDLGQGRPDADYDATKAAIENVVDGYPGFNRTRADLREAADPRRRRARRQAGRGRRRRERRPRRADRRDRRPLLVRVYGEDLGVLRQQAAG